MDLVLEVTRKCNLCCDHCLRGDSQELDMQKSTIDCLTNQLTGSYISIITFTGGEPTLNLKIIDYFVECCQIKNIELESFYIATNGVNNDSLNFIKTLINLYSYCDEKEMCRVETSDTKFHQYERGCAELGLINCLKFVNIKLDSGVMLNEGKYAENFGDGVDNAVVDEDFIYINAKGNVLLGCDWSYDSQEQRTIGRIESVDLKMIQKEIEVNNE